MRALNADFAKQGKTYRDSLDVQLTAERVAGGSFAEFFAKYVAGTEPFPYQEILAMAGWTLRTVGHRRPALGFILEHEPKGPCIVRRVVSEGQAGAAGCGAGDVMW